MELNLSLGGDHRYAASKRKTTSNIGSGGLMESPVGFRGGKSSGEEVSGSRAEDGDRLLLLLPLLGGRRKTEAKVIEHSNEADGMVVTARKKLKLSKEQSSFLEQSFEEHQTLGSNEKLAIAKRLNLRPRQVEVWFQNRRARTKLKNMEEDCAYLRRQCKSLTEENMRLQQELLQLRALKALPAVHHPPLTALTLRPSCRSMDPTAASASTPTN